MITWQTLRWPIALLIFLIFNHPGRVLAQGNINILNPTVDYDFGYQINFQAELATDLTVDEVRLIFRPSGTNNSIVVPAQIGQEYQLQANYNLLPESRIPLFSDITYWYVVTDSSGQQHQTEVSNFRYEDNRFAWQQLVEEGVVAIHWYQGDIAFGQSALNTALNSITHLDQYITLTNLSPFDIYIYANENDMQSTLSLAGEDWLTGHAAAKLNIALVTVSFGNIDQLPTMKRRIPNEVAHIRLYQQIGESYANLPAWFSEGIASLGELSPNPDYRVLLQVIAVQADALIPFSDLCQKFPDTEAKISFVQAQSDSFLRYLHDRFGTNGLTTLLNVYAQGETCEGGVQQVFGQPLTRLSQEWQEQLPDPGLPASPNNFNWQPWLVLLLIMIAVPISAIAASGKRMGEFPGD